MDCEYQAIEPLVPQHRFTRLRAAVVAVALFAASSLFFTATRSLDDGRIGDALSFESRSQRLEAHDHDKSIRASDDSQREHKRMDAPAPVEAPISQRAFFKQRASSLSADQALVVNMTKHAWHAYREYADWHDYLDVEQLTGGTVYKNHDMAWTLVDSLDTLFILGLHDEFDEASAWVKAHLADTMVRRGKVSFFEVTIRSLGGLLSAYYLSGEKHFLEIATVLGDGLSAAFACASDVPCEQVDFVTKDAGDWPSIATASSFQLEFIYLSHATNNSAYAQHAATVNAVTRGLVRDHFHDGLVPVLIDWSTRRGEPSKVSWGAEGDSYYEYPLKQWLLSNKKDDEMKRQYLLAVDGMKARMLGKSYPTGFTFLGEINEFGHLQPTMEHLTCFVPGLLALGYKHGMPKDHLDLAKELARTCVQMYLSTATKLAPETTHFAVAPKDNVSDELIVDAGADHNVLRPETVESLMVLHRVASDPIYRDYGRQIMHAFERISKVPAGGYATMCNVSRGPAFICNAQMESFFLAETLKYLYLLFSDADILPLDAIVFSTEAHPFPILQ